VSATLRAMVSSPPTLVTLSAAREPDASTGRNATELERVVFPRLGPAAPHDRDVISISPDEKADVLADRLLDAEVPLEELLSAMWRHARGDWGDVCAADAAAKEHALRENERLLSSYRSAAGIKFWIITEWDRSSTTALLPEEY